MSSRDFFDRVARDWDEMREGYYSDDVRVGALAAAAVEAGKVAADIGAGTGFISQGLIEEGLRVIAVDQYEVILNEMKTKFARYSAIDYRVGNAEDLPYPLKRSTTPSPTCVSITSNLRRTPSGRWLES